MASDRADVLRRIPLFEGLEDADRSALAALLVEKRYRRGQVLFFEGDPGDTLYIVLSGTVKIYRVAEDGREKTLSILSDGEFFGEMALLDEEPRSAIAETLQPTTVLALTRGDFVKLVEKSPSLSLHIIRVLSRRLRLTNAQLMDVVFRDVRGRVARALLELGERHGARTNQGLRIELKLTHQELANLVGTARETVSWVLAEFQDAGYITMWERRIVVADPDRLEDFASSD